MTEPIFIPPLNTARTILAPDTLIYNPCGDLIFPSIVRVDD